MRRNKIAIVHPRLGWGGSEAVSLWAVEALKDEYDVSLITTGSVDIEAINDFYGTELHSEDFSILKAPLPFFIHRTSKFAALRGRFVQKYSQEIASDFDLMISGYNPCAFGVKGIQLIADLEALPEILPLKSWKRWWYGKTPLRAGYLKLCDLVSPANQTDWERNLSLTNSKWTADLMRRDYGIEANVLYPPVLSGLPAIAGKAKRNGFVCIGRIIPEKRFETIIAILEGIRGLGHDVHLHVIGGSETQDSYERQLRDKTLALHRNWISFEGRLGDLKKKQLISDHLYGISGRTGEPFGIAVAEMVDAGCIVFVPDNGGQVEIVDHSELVYDNVEDAIQKIDRVLSEEDLQGKLRDHLKKGAQRFSVDKFINGMQVIVSEYLREPINRLGT